MPVPGVNPLNIERGTCHAWASALYSDRSATQHLRVTGVAWYKNFNGSFVDHEFILLRVPVEDTWAEIIVERQTYDKPDQVILGTHVNSWDATSLPHRKAADPPMGHLRWSEGWGPTLWEFATLFRSLRHINVEYNFDRGNCFWFAGSVYNSALKMGRITPSEENLGDWSYRRYFMSRTWGDDYDIIVPSADGIYDGNAYEEKDDSEEYGGVMTGEGTLNTFWLDEQKAQDRYVCRTYDRRISF